MACTGKIEPHEISRPVFGNEQNPRTPARTLHSGCSRPLALGPLHMSMVDHSSLNATPALVSFTRELRDAFSSLFIPSDGFDHASAERASLDMRGDLIAFRRPFLTNPALMVRIRHDAALNAPDEAHFNVPRA